jgi:Vanadium chloroperoxidase N-terminal domain/PAP2 superfamily
MNTPMSNFLVQNIFMRNILKLAMIMVIVIMAGCNKELRDPAGNEFSESRFNNPGQGWGNTSPEMVLKWNDAATYVVTNAPPGPPIPPFIESRYYAMVNLAMHDALNSIVPKYKTFGLKTKDYKGVDPNAAVAQAAHDVIVYFFDKLNPPANVSTDAVKNYIHQLLETSLNSVENSDDKAKGIELGKNAAMAIIQKRMNDGWDQAMFPIQQGAAPGAYQFTFPFTIPPFQLPPPFTGFYDSPGWGDITTFGTTSSTQFAVPAPYPIQSSQYAADYNEIKRMGCAGCTGVNGRTQDQEDIARFWVENSPYGWNKVAREVISQKNMDAWKVARLLALLQMAEADAYIASLKAKMIHFFWRPVTAVHMGDVDGNPNTTGDPNWEVLVFPTPPVADHPSAHATAGGAGAELLKQVFENDNVSFTFESATLPGKPRSYSSFSQAARENSLSRIYVGYHFRKACTDGEELGRKVGGWIASHSLASE